MNNSTHRKIWYRQKPKRGLLPWPWEDVGMLIISNDYILFHGKKRSVRIPVEDISGVSIGRQGTDLVNRWVKVKYGDHKLAFFADGGLLGWRGLLGGTTSLFRIIARL